MWPVRPTFHITPRSVVVAVIGANFQAIAPRELLRGYRFSFGYTVDGVEVVAQHEHEESA